MSIEGSRSGVGESKQGEQERQREILAGLDQKYGPIVDRLKEVLSGGGWMSDVELQEKLRSGEEADGFVLTRKAQWELDASVDPEGATDEDLEEGNVESAMVLSRADGESLLKLLDASDGDRAYFTEVSGLEGDLSLETMVSDAVVEEDRVVSFEQNGVDSVSQEFAPQVWRSADKNAYSLEYRLVPAEKYLQEKE